VEIAIAAEALDALVPTLVLQPLVENAIRHGVEPHPRPGRIEIKGERAGGRLILAVSDNGDGLRRDPPAQAGIGLPNTRARLAELYGPDHEFVLGDRPGGGLLVRLDLPFEPAAVPA